MKQGSGARRARNCLLIGLLASKSAATKAVVFLAWDGLTSPIEDELNSAADRPSIVVVMGVLKRHRP